MPKIVDKPEMKRKIMDATLICFSRQGYHATKMTDVATQVGLAKGTLYLYFSGKDVLTVALLKRYFDDLRKTVDDLPLPQSLAVFLDELRSALMLPPDRIGTTRLFFDVLGPGFELPEGRQVIGAFFDHLGAHYADALQHLMSMGLVRQGLNAQMTGAAIASMADGLIIHLALFDPQPQAYAHRVDAAILLFAEGLRTG